MTLLSPYKSIGYYGNTKPLLVKLHGDISGNQNEMVLTKSEFERYCSPETNLARSLMHFSKTDKLLFLGNSLKNDFSVEVIKRSWKNTSFALLPAANTEEAEKRSKELDKLGIIPLFYPLHAIDQRFPEGHNWVAIIMQWLIEKWPAHKLGDSIDATINQDEYFRYDVHLGSNVFQDEQLNLEDLIDFLNLTDDFRWWTICGVGDGGKTRYSKALKTVAESKMGWDVHYFSNEDNDKYSNISKLSLSMNKHTLLIFDDADLYDVYGPINDAGKENRRVVHVKSFFENFIPLMSEPISKSNKRSKLRIIFTYTRSAIIIDKKVSQIYWWESLSNPFKGTNYSSPLEIKWSVPEIQLLIDNYKNQKYATDDLSESEYAGFVKKFKDWLSGLENSDYLTPLTAMFCLDAYVKGRQNESIDILLKKLPIRLARIFDVKSKEMYKLDGFITSLEIYIKDFFESAKTDQNNYENDQTSNVQGGESNANIESQPERKIN